MQWLGSLLFTTFLFVGTLAYAFVVLAFFWLPPLKRHVIARHYARVQLGVLKALCGLDYTVEGRENIPAGTHISMWKHSSAFETIVQMLIFPAQSWVLKRELIWIPFIGWAMHLMSPIAINRSAGARAVNQVVEQGRERLAAGFWILIFPEGTRVAPGETRKYGVSGALLAARTGVKVIPVAHDAGYYWGRRGLLKRRGTIRVVIGPPIETAGRDPREINEDARRWIDATVARLQPPEASAGLPKADL